ATNTCVPPKAWRAAPEQADFPLYRMARPDDALFDFGAAVGALQTARYAAYLALHPQLGSRREVLLNMLWYRHFLHEVRADVIHVQHPLERCSYVRMVQQLEGWRLPLIVTAHSLFGEHDAATIETRMAPNLRAADRVIAVSGHIADQVVELGVDRARVRVIRSGVGVQRFRPRDRLKARRALGIAETTRLVLFVGNLEPRKHVHILIQAMVEVRRRVPLAELVIVGSGESAGVLDQTEALLRLARNLDLLAVVHFVGRVEEQRLLDYYAAA